MTAMTNPRKLAAQSIALIVIIAAAAIGIGINVAYSYINHQGQTSDHKIIVEVDGNGALTIKQAQHSECRAQRSSALDDERWQILYTTLATPNLSPAQVLAAGEEGKRLPSIDTLTNKGGVVGKRHFIPCPPSIASSTTKGTTP